LALISPRQAGINGVKVFLRVKRFFSFKKMNINAKKSLKLASLAVFIGVFAFLTLGYAIASSITPDRVIDMVNQARIGAGLGALVENEKLNQAAQRKAEDMIKNDYFAHNSPSGKTPWSWIDKSDYDYKYAGENLAMNFTNAEDEQIAWMNSPTHKKNILSLNYKDIGVAVTEGKINGQSTIVVVQMFGATPFAALANEKAPIKAAEDYRPEVLGKQENRIIPETILTDPKEDILVNDFTVPIERTGSVSSISSFWTSVKGWLSAATQAQWIIPAALVTLWAIMIGNIFFLAYSLSRKIRLFRSKKGESTKEQRIPVENLEDPEKEEKEISIPVKVHILHTAK
jgi:hypothetical protein